MPEDRGTGRVGVVCSDRGVTDTFASGECVLREERERATEREIFRVE